MPQPRRAAQPTAPGSAPPAQPRPPSTIGAEIAAATAAPAGTLVAGAIAGALTVAEIRTILAAALAALRRLSSARAAALAPLILSTAMPVRRGASLAERTPSSAAGVLAQLAADERDRELMFRARQSARIRRDLPRALRERDDRRRRRRLQGLVGRESHYTRLRMDAIAVRAAGVADSINVELLSPTGCVWQLGRTVHHTAGCLYLHGRALAWGPLRAGQFIPPLHLRCDCRLRPIAAAVTDGLLRRLVVPTREQTLALLAEAKRLEAA
jgi:hypothetical protein